MTESEKEIWVGLSELFFLDDEPQPYQFQRVADLLKNSGVNRRATEQLLIQLIAPIPGANFGYLIYPPVAPEWSGFDRTALCDKIKKRKALRAGLPSWRFIISDWWSKRMLKSLEWERLLDLL